MISIPEIGSKGIEKLRMSKVLLVGAGALGSLCAMYLAGAGVGNLTIAEFDTIDISNLQRQLFFTTSQAGESKLEVICKRIKDINPGVNVLGLKKMITSSIALEIFPKFDFIIDATDNPHSKMMTDSIATQCGKFYCIGGVSGLKGQVMCSGPGFTTYSEIFNPEGVCQDMMPCSINGVLGPVAGIISCIQACETIKHLTGTGEMLLNRVLIFDAATMQCQTLSLSS